MYVPKSQRGLKVRVEDTKVKWLIENAEIPEITEIQHKKMDKDGTIYQMMAFKIPGVFSMGGLGSVEDGWLVVSHLKRRAYLFKERGELDPTYIGEKFGGSSRDAENMTILLGELIGRPYPSWIGK